MKTFIITTLFALVAATAQAAPKSTTEVRPHTPQYDDDDQFEQNKTNSRNQELRRDRRATYDTRHDDASTHPQGTRDLKDSDGSIKENQ
ncbi:hypothetical protein [Bdellovibrio sp. HCB274]|uniref:hypothetical protein n=1 Tax=Bdellovibrio sp. HCB274 TaxID=3394361 RepID=UPI0039B684ED